MKIAAVTLLAVALACGQTGSKEPWKTKGMADVKMLPPPKVPHIHGMLLECKGAPDRVYGKSGRVYYACVQGKEVCSEEKGKISRSMIEEYEAGKVASNRTREEVKAAIEGAQTRSSVVTLDNPNAVSDAAPPPPVADDRVKELPVGTPRAEVLEMLGEPYLKISGEVEYYTYRLKSGATAELEFSDGKLKKIRTEPAK